MSRMTSLSKHVSQLMRVESDLLDSLYDEVEATAIDWVESFSDYQSGGWEIASLYNATGDATYDVPQESAIKPTPLIKRMPRMKAFLDSTGLDYMMVRLARGLPNSYLYEHSDYRGLEKYEKLRLHLPLYTHPQAVMSLIDVNVYLKRGFLWKLDPQSVVHGVRNVGQEPRVHLILDCYMNPVLESLVENEWLDRDAITEVPEMTRDEIARVMEQASALLLRKDSREAEHFLLTTFFDYRHRRGFSGYEMILNLYEKHPDRERMDYWLDRLEDVYGEAYARERLSHTRARALSVPS